MVHTMKILKKASFLLFLCLSTQAIAADEGKLAQPADARPNNSIVSNLRELIDARGLALLVEDDAAARRLGKMVAEWRKRYEKLLKSDPELKRIDLTTQQIFRDNLAGRHAPAAGLPKLVAAIPKFELHRTLNLWLKSLFHRRGVSFQGDLDRLPKVDLAHICERARALDSRKGLSSWRYRVLLWRWRDSQAKELFAARDERLAFLTPVRIDEAKLKAADRLALHRYLAMLRNLRLEVVRNRELPYERYRTLYSLLRGLRYMDTIREAAQATGLNHRMMTGLYIQESEFVHHRVSVAGAFSIAQFLNIAIKDVWLFKKRIPGSKEILKGFSSWEQIKLRMIEDPRFAIKVSCLYFRRVRDMVAGYMGSSVRSREMLDLLSVELFTLREHLMEAKQFEATRRMEAFWPVRSSLPVPATAVGGVAVPDPAALLASWTERSLREMTLQRLSEEAFEKRLERLLLAMGLAAYNAGAGNLMKTAKRKHPFQALSFPLQIDETRGYVDGILDAWDILDGVGRIASDVERMRYDDLLRLAERACTGAGIKKAPPLLKRSKPAKKSGK